MLQSFARTGIAAATLAIASFGPASGADATIYNVTSAGLYNYGTVRMTGNIAGHGAFDKTEYAGAILLKGTTAGGAPFSVITFCFDLLHSINVGFGSQGAFNYSFSSQPVTNDLSSSNGTGNALTATQIERMSGLANLGGYLLTSGASDLTARMMAIQSAIWSVEYGLTASSFSVPNAATYYASYMTGSFPGASTRVLVASNAQGQLIGNVQGLGIGTVPEPESWALLIIGFGVVGASARRSRRMKMVAA